MVCDCRHQVIFKMNRFFFQKNKLINGHIVIEGEDVIHISKVLRLAEGDQMVLCDGDGFDYISEIKAIDKTFVKAEVLEKKVAISEPTMETTLFQGIPKGDKMDLIIQKSVEMGISRIVPVLMHRSIVKIDNEKDGRKKQERWQRIAMEAAKQSGRGSIPEVTVPVSFKEALKMSDHIDYKILPYEKEESLSIKKSINDFLDGARAKAGNMDDSSRMNVLVAIMVGPEGGFEVKEVEKAMNDGFKPVTLGKRILRTETAGFVALACIMYEFNEMD